MDEHRDIPYLPAPTRSPLHELDLYVPRTPPARGASRPPLICFVHGGAWRAEDKADYADLARRLAARTGCPVAVPNYRLTGAAAAVRHPAHAEDVLAALLFLLAWPGPGPDAAAPGPPYDPARMYLLGHSCSAHMLAAIVLDSSRATPTLTPPAHSLPVAAAASASASASRSLDPGLEPAPALFPALRGLVLSEGIYDLDLLLTAFPAYRAWFVAPAFGDGPSYAPFDTTSHPRRAGAEHVRWLVLHSPGDDLVDEAQSAKMYQHLCALYGEPEGADDEGAGAQAQDGTSVRRVLKNFDALSEGHDEVLLGARYEQLVADFVLADAGLDAPGAA